MKPVRFSKSKANLRKLVLCIPEQQFWKIEQMYLQFLQGELENSG